MLQLTLLKQWKLLSNGLMFLRSGLSSVQLGPRRTVAELLSAKNTKLYGNSAGVCQCCATECYCTDPTVLSPVIQQH